jgi:hypothetical protein
MPRTSTLGKIGQFTVILVFGACFEPLVFASGNKKSTVFLKKQVRKSTSQKNKFYHRISSIQGYFSKIAITVNRLFGNQKRQQASQKSDQKRVNWQEASVKKHKPSL